MLATLSTAAVIGTVAFTPAAHAASPAYSGSAKSTIVQADATIAGQSLADLGIGVSSADADSSKNEASADSSNLSAALAGFDIPIDDTSVSAPPTATKNGPVPAANLDPLIDLGLIQESASANYSTSTGCPSPTSSPLGTSTTTLATTNVVTIPAAVPVLGGQALASVGASETTSITKVSGTSLVSTATATIGAISLLGGNVVLKVTSPVTLTATSDGTKGSLSFDNPTITVTIAGQTPIDVTNQDGGSISLPAPLNALASLSITALHPTDTSTGRTGSGSLPALFTVDLSLVPAIGAASVHLAIAPMSVTATAPSGGVSCTSSGDGSGNGGSKLAPEGGGKNAGKSRKDSDGDGLPDWYETQVTHTNPNKKDSNGNGTPDGQEDADHDGLSNEQEYLHGTNPTKADTDGDGLTDGQEVHGVSETYYVRKSGDKKPVKVHKLMKTNPLKKDTDGDGCSDTSEEKGSTITYQLRKKGWSGPRKTTLVVKTDPTLKDTDGDGLSDCQEIKGTKNAAFGHQPSNPLDWDTDGGGVGDGNEVKAHSNPDDSHSGPGRPAA